MSQWHRPHAPATTQHSLCPHLVQRFVAPSGVPPKVPVAPPACVSHHPAQPFLPAPHRAPSTALRGPIASSTEGPSGTARMRQPSPSTTFFPCASPA
eukprot:6405073-Pyramimonas_sp.AAC.1